MIEDYSTIKVGQQVSVQSRGHSEGVYEVTKVNKMRVEVKRISDGYERAFSVKTQIELNRLYRDRYNTARIETVHTKMVREACEAARRIKRELFDKAAEAATRNHLADLKELVQQLENLA
jgi:histidyl-tRNA synthetase